MIKTSNLLGKGLITLAVLYTVLILWMSVVLIM